MHELIENEICKSCPWKQQQKKKKKKKKKKKIKEWNSESRFFKTRHMIAM